MLENAMTTEYEHIELFGEPGLFTNGRIDKTTVPKGWFCYDVRGSDDDPGEPARLENRVMVNHAGTVIMPEEIVFPQGEDSVNIQGELNFVGESISLAEFCEIYGRPANSQSAEYTLRPARPEETGLFNVLPQESDAELGCIGYVRMDFGCNSEEFWHTWHSRGPQELNSPEFKAELTGVVDYMRESVLRDLRAMQKFCHERGGEIECDREQNYGYLLETEHYRYCLRCNPWPGDYQAYLICFDKRVQEMNQSQQAGPNMTMGGIS